MKRILIAPNSFRGSLNALEVAQALEKGLKTSNTNLEVTLLPIADGGDYFTEVMVFALDGEMKEASTFNPLGKTIKVKWGKKDNVAFIEVAKASGTNLLEYNELNPYKTSTYGTGILIKEAILAGCKEIILGLGGSATVDGGIGILQALGFEFYDNKNQSIKPESNKLIQIASVNVENVLPELSQCSFQLICDVDNPLLGNDGAAKVFGPQKGATPKQVEILEQNLTHFAKITKQFVDKDISNIKHGGAAGGIAAFLHAFLNAKLKSGTETILDILNFDSLLLKHDIIITGEGKLDSQTLNGKGPHGVALRAKQQGRKVIGIAGSIPRERLELYKDFDLILPICDRPLNLDEAMQKAEILTKNLGYRIGQILLMNIN